MAKRRLRRRIQEACRNTGHVLNIGPVPLTIPQCYTHCPGLNCLQTNACLFQAANFPCRSGCTLENCRNGALHRLLLHQGSRSARSKSSRGPNIPPNHLPFHLPFCLSPRRTDVLAQRPHETSQVACLTGAHWHRPRDPSANQEHCPQPRHTSSFQDR